jgi:hypothetical protein
MSRAAMTSSRVVVVDRAAAFSGGYGEQGNVSVQIALGADVGT